MNAVIVLLALLTMGMPDFANIPGATVVAESDTLAVCDEATYGILVIDGTLEVCGTLRVQTLHIKPSGTLIYKNGALIIIRDLPFHPYDVEQHGNGVLIEGKVICETDYVTPHAAFANVYRGDIHLIGTVPADWRVGDELVLPRTTINNPPIKDAPFWTAEQKKWPRVYTESERVKIKAIEQNRITLTTPIAWGHTGAVDRNGNQATFMRVANLTRRAVIRSENPRGIRGHVMAMGRADVRLESVALKDLGRTTIHDLNSMLMDSQGNWRQSDYRKPPNQIGRYPFHAHHVPGPEQTDSPYQLEVVNIVIDGGDEMHPEKGGIVLHRTSWALVKDNVVYNVAGGMVVEEDGCERNNTYENNYLCRSYSRTHFRDADGGWMLPEHEDPTDPERQTDLRWTGSNGFWFARSYGIICRDNIIGDLNSGFGKEQGKSWNPDEVASAYWVSEALHYKFMPTERGQDMADWKPFKTNEVAEPHWSITGGEVFTGNGDAIGGLEDFGSFCTVRDLTVWHTPIGFRDYWMAMDVENCRLYGTSNYMPPDTIGIDTNRKNSRFKSIPIDNFSAGIQIREGNRGKDVLLEDIDMACLTNIRILNDTGVPDSLYRIVRPKMTLKKYNVEWSSKMPSSLYREETFTNNEIRIEDWNGKTYRLYGAPQLPSVVIPPTRHSLPYSGLTNQQCWDRFGKATYGALVPRDAVRLPNTSGVYFK